MFCLTVSGGTRSLETTIFGKIGNRYLGCPCGLPREGCQVPRPFHQMKSRYRLSQRDPWTPVEELHPLLMVIGFVLLSGEAIMAYKSVPAYRKLPKFIHSLMHFVALGSGIVGIYAVFKFHGEKRIPHMYSFHSWLGMSTICLFALQWLFSFLSFVYPQAQASTRKRLAPWHAALGIIIFFMAIISAETGLVEKFFFLGLRQNQEALVVNFTALLIFMFAAFVLQEEEEASMLYL